jgi:hypothetical protein
MLPLGKDRQVAQPGHSLILRLHPSGRLLASRITIIGGEMTVYIASRKDGSNRIIDHPQRGLIFCLGSLSFGDKVQGRGIASSGTDTLGTLENSGQRQGCSSGDFIRRSTLTICILAGMLLT